ncbi:HD domain-containing protein [Streptomyces nigrescens]|nr:HD domain-containing protein [Streptomyces nigrescens]
MPEQMVDTRVWGKARGLARRYPLICHLLDTAAVAGALWDRALTESARTRVAGVLGLEEAQVRRLVSLWGAMLKTCGSAGGTRRAYLPDDPVTVIE